MYDFYAFLNRLKLINRWSLMRNTKNENVAEHSFQVVIITHALCVIEKEIYKHDIDIHKAILIALYHDSGEVFTGDLPTPVKYYNEEIKEAYKKVENKSLDKLLSMLPERFTLDYEQYIKPDTFSKEYRFVKYADKISALIKCVEENDSGNMEFVSAYDSIISEINAFNSDAVIYFMKNYFPSYKKNLDDFSI